MADALDTSQIKHWRSIITLIVFVATNVIVLFPFHIPIYVPVAVHHAITDILSATRIIAPRQRGPKENAAGSEGSRRPMFKRLDFPLNMVTAPLIADLFLLAILAIGRKEVHDGTVGADHIYPIEIMVFFLTLAYIAISIDASGLIRWLAFKVLQKSGDNGSRLFCYLYVFFFGLACLVGNDPIILSGTAFLAYMTRMSANIEHPKAWIYTQFATANIGSAILVSSNPTNLVLAGAFQIKFIEYTANVIVPVVFTALVLLPFLLFVLFRSSSLIPTKIEQHELTDEMKEKDPINPNIPFARGRSELEQFDTGVDDPGHNLPLEEILNPYLDKKGAAFGVVIMGATLITILVLNASSSNGSQIPVFYITLPAAVVMFCWDVTFGWKNRHHTRDIAKKGREEIEQARNERAGQKGQQLQVMRDSNDPIHVGSNPDNTSDKPGHIEPIVSHFPSQGISELEKASIAPFDPHDQLNVLPGSESIEENDHAEFAKDERYFDEKNIESGERDESKREAKLEHKTLASVCIHGYRWSQETFPTAVSVLALLPFKLVPFALCMFVLVQALVTKGWVSVFAYGWTHWVHRTGTVGAIGGMAFLSVVLCNFAGTNIGTTILLCRIIQAWVEIHQQANDPISSRTFWATVYSLAINVNYGAFSTAFSASLAGLLWRDILARKYIRVGSLDFARINLPIIAFAVVIGCAVLIGEVYIARQNTPYTPISG